MNIAATIFFICILGGNIFAKESDDKGNYKAETQRINTQLKIDGKLDESEWSTAKRYTIGFEIEPGENTVPRAETIFFTLYNDEYLYFAFRCFDPNPSEIRATVTDRDKIFNDDFVIILLDTYSDNQRTYELLVNPYGIQGDLLRTGNNEDPGFDIIWYSAAERTETGYTVEMAIPFKSIKFPDSDSPIWALQAGRIFPRENRYVYFWTPSDRNNPCFMCQSGKLIGLSDIPHNISAEILPYAIGFQSARLEDSDDPDKGFFNEDLKGRIGAGFKVNPSSSMTMEGVVNPDFSQVESDAQQISVNSTFSLYYEEKRPFFLEGIELFRSGMSVFYTRLINNPLYAAKITGKQEKVSYALLTAYDRNTLFIVPGEEGSSTISSSEKSFSNILRARYDFAEDSYFGAIITTRDLSGGHNYNAGIDWNYLFEKQYYIRGLFLFSNTEEVSDSNIFNSSRKFGSTQYNAAFNGEKFSGTALRLDFKRSSRNHYFEMSYRDISPLHQSQMGFMTKNNTRSIEVENAYTIYPEESVVTNSYIFARYGLAFNHSHVRKDNWLVVGVNTVFKGQIRTFAGVLPINAEQFKGQSFSNIFRYMFEVNARPSDALAIGFDSDFGKFIYRSDNPKTGRGHNLDVWVTIKISDQFQSGFDFGRSRLSDINTGELFYDGYILRNTTTYQFSEESYLRMISEYNSFEKSINLFPLFSYKLNAFTIFYIGSTNNLREFDKQDRWIQSERQYFLKIQYLWTLL